MSCDFRCLGVMSYVGGFTAWHYRSTDPVVDCVKPGYFDVARDMIAVGDLVHVTAPDGFAMLYALGAPPPEALVGGQRGAKREFRLATVMSFSGTEELRNRRLELGDGMAAWWETPNASGCWVAPP